MTAPGWAVEEDEFGRTTDALIEHARRIAPDIRARSFEAEALRRQPEETMNDAEPFWPALVPKVWGGLGLGARALCEVARELAHGDASAAWTVAFLMEHNWMACHFPWEAQRELFATRPYILAAAPLQPGGVAHRVDGGFAVNATFRYSSGVWNSDWTFGTAIVEEDDEKVAWTFLIPLDDVTVNDDWFMSGMAATSSSSVTAADVFVPERRAVRTDILNSQDLHPGATHEESFLRYPQLAAVTLMMAAIVLGAAEATVDIGRERLSVSKVMGQTRRIDMTLSRIRWAESFEQIECARLLYMQLLDRTIAQCDMGVQWSGEQIGRTELDILTVIQLSQKAANRICDGLGSSIYKMEDPLQRFRRDINVMANHVALEFDVVAERATRMMLGLGALPSDPPHLQVPRSVDA